MNDQLNDVRESSETFEELYVREFGAIVALAYALSGSRAAAEDLAQEAFLAAHQNWEKVADLDAPGAWVRRVVANMSVSAFRRGIAETKALTRVALGHQQVMPELSADDAEFWRVVRSLPRRQAQVIAPLLGRPTYRRDRADPRHGERHGEEASARRPAGPRPPARTRGGRVMDLDTRARSAAQGIRRAVEVMEMSTDTQQPRKVERFDQYQGRKNRNRKVGALAVAAAVAVIFAIVAVNATRTDRTQLGRNPAINWPISAPGSGGFTVDLATGKAAPLPDSIAQAGDGYAVSPDHTKVAYVACCTSSSSLYIANMDGTGITQITSDRSNALGPEWSPDGSKIVYQQRSLDPNSNALGNLFVYDVATGRSTRITNLDQSTRTGGWWFMFPSFVPTDGASAVLFQMPRGTYPQVWDLWSVPVSGGKPVIVQKDAGWGAVNPIGTLAYATPVSPYTFNGGRVMVRNGGQATAPRPLVRGPLVKMQWSPDGTRVAYVGKNYIYVVNVEDASTTKVVKGGNVDWFDDHTLVVNP